MHVVREVLLDADVDEVWALLTDADELSSWFGGDASIDARPGGAGRFVDGDTVLRAVVDEVADRERLRFRWWPEGDDGADSSVVFELHREGDRTRLVVEERAAEASAAGRGGGKACLVSDDCLIDLELRCLTRRLAPVPITR